ncbi:hypothetical protein LTR66_003283 [Elasticomyces elasticus]|nr:hypothetical protein LTR66_003283 [Elasticomyces elasticus]
MDYQELTLLTLPAEIRNAIYELVFDPAHACTISNDECGPGVDEAYTTWQLERHGPDTSLLIKRPRPSTSNIPANYTTLPASHHLLPLLTCRQIHAEANLLAYKHTFFKVTNLFFDIPTQLRLLRVEQVRIIRSLALVADKRHFTRLLEWCSPNNPEAFHVFGVPDLQLNELRFILHRTSYWQYLFDFTKSFTTLLRSLSGVKRIVFERNGAKVKGTFFTWCNRLIGLMLKMDHHHRYVVQPPRCEQSWWSWQFDSEAETLSLIALPAKVVMSVADYENWVKPLREELEESMTHEEWNPDPMSRISTY